ncbi:2OG-Fe(II) oxygenase [Burkholderia sp. L27(2015)]|uniref:2OG-Fe(II) oxygenase n=1 Tax=Burkholderia sp. L27(2015) TaxID=1641858 RepID=UPI0015756847|nr:2OG-Fe(II) oxygenase [Burkholderia sp. L27(2015)]
MSPCESDARMSIPALQAQDWPAIEQSLYTDGNALLPALLTAAQCEELAAMYEQDQHFRTRVVMARHGFGLGEYKYFAYPLPNILAQLREALYSRLAPVANHWNRLMGVDVRYPETLPAFLDRCHAAGQIRPTPLILKYGEGDYNCLHQDLYGDHVFALQVAILLDRPGIDFTGGEFVMTQSSTSERRVDVVPLRQGDGVAFTVNQRPVQGRRTTRRVAMRHGVSQVRSGHRYTVGLIFHDAR